MKTVRIVGLILFIIGLIMTIHPFTAFEGYDIQKTSMLFITMTIGFFILIIGFVIALYTIPKKSKVE